MNYTKAKVVQNGYSFEDKETSASYDYLLKEWFVYSSVPTHITRMLKLYPDKVEIMEYLDNENRTPVLIRAKLPNKALGFRAIKQITEEERQVLSENARRNLHNAK